MANNDRWTERKLDAADRPKAVYEYYATGRGAFPFDMLRYDAAWPADGDAAGKLDGREYRSVRLRSYRAPTLGRWQSFVWSVGKTALVREGMIG